jgi:hypothetical protein
MQMKAWGMEIDECVMLMVEAAEKEEENKK